MKIKLGVNCPFKKYENIIIVGGWMCTGCSRNKSKISNYYGHVECRGGINKKAVKRFIEVC